MMVYFILKLVNTLGIDPDGKSHIKVGGDFRNFSTAKYQIYFNAHLER